MSPSAFPLRSTAVSAALALTIAGGVLMNAPAASAQTPARRIQLAVAAMLNAERHAHHLAPVTLNPRLDISAAKHSALMDAHGTMSHQLPGEPFFAARISATGYRWAAVGENIAWTTDYSVTGVLDLQRAMYDERAPHNGHRLNIVSRIYRNVGIGVALDPVHHRMYLTEDFGRAA